MPSWRRPDPQMVAAARRASAAATAVLVRRRRGAGLHAGRRAARRGGRGRRFGDGKILASMPGRIALASTVAVGDGVTRGQPLVTLEAMKMEHALDRALRRERRGWCAAGSATRWAKGALLGHGWSRPAGQRRDVPLAPDQALRQRRDTFEDLAANGARARAAAGHRPGSSTPGRRRSAQRRSSTTARSIWVFEGVILIRQTHRWRSRQWGRGLNAAARSCSTIR